MTVHEPCCTDARVVFDCNNDHKIHKVPRLIIRQNAFWAHRLTHLPLLAAYKHTTEQHHVNRECNTKKVSEYRKETGF